VQDENDPATRTVKKLMDDYPKADVQLLTCTLSIINLHENLQTTALSIFSRFYLGATTGGVNPKINNMLQGYKVAKFDLIWINDSALYGKFQLFY
jgi:ceramide glucosyltransferase